jgi:CHAT domain-containing protein
MPSLSLTDLRYVGVKDLGVLAMGAEKFSDQEPLPGVPIELENILGIWPGTKLPNEQFTRKNLVESRIAQQLGILHLATHADFLGGDLSNSYIQLWDGRLQLGQVRELKLYAPPVELVTFSACRTAVGDPEAELGFTGFATKAGVKSAVGSLWYVDDRATTGLMINFYAKLGKTAIQSKAEALRQAQLSLLNGDMRQENTHLITSIGEISLPEELAHKGSSQFHHPYFWSGFTIVGTPW